MADSKDYYQILGVNKNSTQDDIKKAYRKLAREHHPDMVKDADKDAAERRFKEINEAYQVLSDPQKRKMYDQFGTANPQGGFGGASAGQWGPFTYTSSGGTPFDFSDFDPFDVFEDFFGFRGYGSSRRPKRGKNLYYELRLSLKDTIFGIEREINVESGKFNIKIPAGVREGTEIRYSGKGMPGPDGAPAGDLLITVRIHHNEDFNIVGSDLFIVREINFIEAALGTEIEIPIIDTSKDSGLGKTKLKIPGGTQYGTKFVVRGKGMPRINSRGFGDILVQILIKTPQRLSKKQRNILEDYLKA